MQKKKKYRRILSFVLALVLILPMFSMMNINKVYAEEQASCSVLEDLQKDASFNVENYLAIENDYSLQVITIAESSSKELLIYTYQPSGDFVDGSSINISVSADDSLDIKNYKLKQLDSYNTLFKYSVEGFKVSNESVRYYAISSIFRLWNWKIDLDMANGNSVTEVSYNVGKKYSISDSGMSMVETVIETIEISSKYVGFCRYDSGYTGNSVNLGVGQGAGVYAVPGYDSHFIAFSTDKPIDRLYNIDVYYCSQLYSYESSLFKANEQYGAIEEKFSHITYTDKEDLTVPHGGMEYKYSFDRIQSVADFIKCENIDYVYDMGLFNVNVVTNLTEEGLADISGHQWVVRFAETEWSNTKTGAGFSTMHFKKHTIISDVTILRLSFMVSGTVYNLGVVDNKQSGDGVSDSETGVEIDVKDWVKFILFGIGLIIVLIIVIPCMPFILKAIFLVVEWVLWLLILPFKLIIQLIDKIRNS